MVRGRIRRGRRGTRVVEPIGRTPRIGIREVFRRAAGETSVDPEQSEVVAESLGYLQRGFDSHYDADTAGDEEILLGDGSYAWAIETIARLDEPDFVAVASRLIRDGAGCISSGGAVNFELWLPHLAGLLAILTGEGPESSEARIRRSAAGLDLHDGSGSPAFT